MQIVYKWCRPCKWCNKNMNNVNLIKWRSIKNRILEPWTCKNDVEYNIRELKVKVKAWNPSLAPMSITWFVASVKPCCPRCKSYVVFVATKPWGIIYLFPLSPVSSFYYYYFFFLDSSFSSSSCSRWDDVPLFFIGHEVKLALRDQMPWLGK